MRRLGKVLLGMVAVLVVVVLAVLAVRTVNHVRYPEPALEYPDPMDAAAYPTELPGVAVAPIADGPVRGFHLRPDDIRHEGVVLVWGGSEGGPDFAHAELLARSGHEVLSLFYFGQPEQPDTLNRVPVETASLAIDWAEAHAANAANAVTADDAAADSAADTADTAGAVSVGPITLVGTSKGAELAALLPAFESRVDNVVLFAPVDHVTQGLDQLDVASSWTHDGREVPYVAFAEAPEYGPALGLMSAMIFNYPMHLRPAYEAALAGPGAADARIDLTRVPGEVLIFAGGDDQLWPADTAARRFAEDRPERTEVHVYPDAGHVFDIPADYAEGMRMGGSAEANAAARDASDVLLVDRLAQWHQR